VTAPEIEDEVRPGSEGGRPKVLYLSRNYPNAAIPRLGLWVEGLVRHSQDKWDSCVVAPVPYCPPIPFLSENYRRFRRVPKRLRSGGAEVFHPRALTPPGGRFRALEGKWLLACVAPQVDALFRTFHFDLIHAHFTYPDGWVAAQLGASYGVPVIITEHASWRGWAGHRAVWAMTHCAAHVSVGTALRDEIKEMAPGEDHLHVIPCGVDGTVFTLPPADVERDPHQILFVGAVRPVKGLDVLLRAMHILARQGREETLVVIGDSYFGSYVKARRDAESLVGELGLGRRVTFLAGMDQKDVARFMQQSAVLVSSSRRETLGMVLVEALACGTPVVATQSGGPADIVTPEVGRLVPVEAPEALAEAIAQVVDTHTTYSAERLRAHALASFDWAHVTNSYLKLYHDALRGHGR
jgi:glycosyltransferase involved in cell wall biosynthesis